MGKYKSSKKWMMEEILNLREGTRAKESQNTERYKELNKQIKRECAKEKWFMTDAKK